MCLFCAANLADKPGLLSEADATHRVWVKPDVPRWIAFQFTAPFTVAIILLASKVCELPWATSGPIPRHFAGNAQTKKG